MPKFRKKPVEIEAMQFIGPDPTRLDELVKFDDWVVANQGSRKCRYKGDKMIIPTLEGNHEASPGDWIIRGVNGELYPIKDEIFKVTYDPV